MYYVEVKLQFRYIQLYKLDEFFLRPGEFSFSFLDTLLWYFLAIIYITFVPFD